MIAEALLIPLLLGDVFDPEADDGTVLHEPSLRHVRVAKNAEHGERRNELLRQEERADVRIAFRAGVPILRGRYTYRECPFNDRFAASRDVAKDSKAVSIALARQRNNAKLLKVSHSVDSFHGVSPVKVKGTTFHSLPEDPH
ncbi:MAG: hypothetical protein IAG10_03740 [Planctomycetaceae bacterium]|nr:hypothetical protein [Planctomycetaceae bacterium]